MAGNIIAMRATPQGWLRVGSTRNSGLTPDGIGVQAYAPTHEDGGIVPFIVGTCAEFANKQERGYVLSALNASGFQSQYWNADHMSTQTHVSGVSFEFWHDRATQGGELLRTS